MKKNYWIISLIVYCISGFYACIYFIKDIGQLAVYEFDAKAVNLKYTATFITRFM